MIENIVKDHETIVRNLREDAETVADKFGDVATEDLLIGILQEHEEMAWMLRSFLERQAA